MLELELDDQGGCHGKALEVLMTGTAYWVNNPRPQEVRIKNDDLKVIRRIMSEVGLGLLCCQLLKELGEVTVGDPLGGYTKAFVVFAALQNDVLGRLSKVLDSTNDPNNRNFTYICEQYSDDVKRGAKKEGIRLSCIKNFSKRLRKLRNKTLVHIDKTSVSDSHKLWRNVGLKPSELEACLTDIFRICRYLHALEATPETPLPKFRDPGSGLRIDQQTEGKPESS